MYLKLMKHYKLGTRSRFLQIRDGVVDIPHICLAVWFFLALSFGVKGVQVQATENTTFFLLSNDIYYI